MRERSGGELRSLYVPHQDTGQTGEAEAEISLRYALMLFVVASSLIFFGLTVLYSTSYGVAGPMYFKKQLMWAGIGFSLGTIVFLLGYRRMVSISPWLILLSIILLGGALCFPAVKGAHRWIKIPHIGNIQPSEYAKLAVALFLARCCADKIRNISGFTVWEGVKSFFRRDLMGIWSVWGGLVQIGVCCGSVMVMVLAGKDLGTTVLLGIVVVLTLFLAGLKLRYVILPVITVPPLLFFVIKNFDAERWSRMTSFLDPERCQKEDGYQLWNSLLALGSGNWFGVGFMASRLKHKYLPEAHTDFILSIVGEELGLCGMCAVILAYLLFLFAAVRITANASTRQGIFLGASLTALLILQACINIGVVSGAFPTKGMPAPFISYGGSNLVVCMLATSLLLSIALETARPGFAGDLIDDLKNYLRGVWHKWI